VDGATKAFDIVMAEGLWAELHGTGVDVLSLVLGATDTPAFRRMLVKRGVLSAADDATPLPGVATAGDVVAEAIANLSNGPTWFAGEQLREAAERLSALPRRDAVTLMLERVSIMDPAGDGEARS
jgi:short-subunit dehydrogenase